MLRRSGISLCELQLRSCAAERTGAACACKLVRWSRDPVIAPSRKDVAGTPPSLQDRRGVSPASSRSSRIHSPSMRPFRCSVFLRLVVLGAFVASVLGCAAVGQLTNLDEPTCSAAFETQLATILLEQGEKSDVSQALAHRTELALASGSLGPRPFEISSSSGVDYTFFVQPKNSVCLLRLYGRQKGFTSYTNNLTYIATKPLSPCTCSE